MFENTLFERGENVLVFLVSGYNPAVYAGKVSRIIAHGAELVDAVMVHRCENGQWGLLAEGDEAIRTASSYRYAGTIAFSACSRRHVWQGELPKASL